jgi:hypothetical protein
MAVDCCGGSGGGGSTRAYSYDDAPEPQAPASPRAPSPTRDTPETETVELTARQKKILDQVAERVDAHAGSSAGPDLGQLALFSAYGIELSETEEQLLGSLDPKTVSQYALQARMDQEITAYAEAVLPHLAE